MTDETYGMELEKRVLDLEKRLASATSADNTEASDESKFRRMYLVSPIPTYIWKMDGKSFVLADANEAARLITRDGVDRFIGSLHTELFKDNIGIAHDIEKCFQDQRSIRKETPYRLQTTGEQKIFSVSYAYVAPDMVLVHTDDITERRQAEVTVREKEGELEIKSRQLEEVNQALRTLLSQSKEEGKQFEQRVVANVEDLVMPYVLRLKMTKLNVDQQVYLNVIESNLAELVAPFMRKIGTKFPELTPREIEVANMVRMGTTSKDIARLLVISKRAVEFHRDSLRTKLGLKKTKKNLRAYLASLD